MPRYPDQNGKIMAGSTDVGDVSFITPTAQFGTTCWPFSLAEHSWQTTASTGTSIGSKGMIVAAKVLGRKSEVEMTIEEITEGEYDVSYTRQRVKSEKTRSRYKVCFDKK
ncbi:unnamed protein product, partial [marine sediment metagenome]